MQRQNSRSQSILVSFPTSCWKRTSWLRKAVEPASSVQAIQANDEEATGEYLPEWHPVNGRPPFRRVTPSAVEERNFGQ